MGKNRVATIGDESLEEEEKQKKARKKAQKKARLQSAEQNDGGQAHEAAGEENQTTDDSQNESEKQETTPVQDSQEPNIPVTKQPKKPKSKFAKTKKRSANYTSKVIMIDKNKSYSLPEALSLLQKVRMAKFDEAVELHINTVGDGISGQVKLPHGTGKEIKVAIADDAVLAQVEKGKIEFDVLIATPDMMPKLAKVARVLGPKGLMPNPKNGTISANPSEAAKAFQGGLMYFKTETKLPVMHLTVGRISFEPKQLSENITTALSKIGKERIQKVVLKSTMSPGIKLAL